MKFSTVIPALAACVLMASCSSDELSEINDADAITFNVTTGAISRATDVYCNANLPSAFKVWATYKDGVSNPSTYIDGDDVALRDGKWVNLSGQRFMPASGSLDFFAVVNDGGLFEWNNGAPEIKDFSPASLPADQVDLLYAVKTDRSKASGSTQVDLNFRHALSQVVFQAKNTNANLYVEVEGVTVCNVAGKGTYTYAATSTDGNTQDHSGAGTYQTAGRGSWDLASGSASAYAASFPTVALTSTASALTGSDENGQAWGTTMMLLPQATTPWNPGAGKPANSTGTYFLVKCKIWNVAGTSHADNDVVLWSDEDGNAADVAIPVSIDWQEGKKYVYTFIFGEGNGGFDPEGPDPVLLPVTFNVTVDDFVEVDNQDVKMDN